MLNDHIGPRLFLRAIEPGDIPELHKLATRAETGVRWRYRGSPPPIDVFAATLNDGVLLQMVACEQSSGNLVGLVVAYSADLRSGVAYFGSVMSPDVLGRRHGAEATMLFVRYLLQRFPLRKLYAEYPEFSETAFGDRLAKRTGSGMLQVEARLTEHIFYDGKYWDQVTIAGSADAWRRLAEESLAQFVRVDGSDAAAVVHIASE